MSGEKILSAIGGPVVSGIFGLGGAAVGSRAANKAAKTQDDAARRAEAIALDNERRRRQEYDQREAMAKQQYDETEMRRAPYRQAASALLGQNARRLGLGNVSLPPPRPYQAQPYQSLSDYARS